MRQSIRRTAVTLSFLVPALTTVIAGPAAHAGASGTAALGVYVPDGGSPTYAPIGAFVKALRSGTSIVPPAIIQDFFGWGTRAKPSPFPTAFAQFVHGEKATPMITWQPSHISTNPATTSVLQVINSKAEDKYIKNWARAAKALGYPVYVRLMHEMNGEWYPWGYHYKGLAYNKPANYVKAFKHVVNLFQQVHATNVEFVWCAATAGQDHSLSAFFPTPVPTNLKWIALDGYNKNRNQPVSFTKIFSNDYSQLTAFPGSLPVMIAETASVVTASTAFETKAQWITRAFSTEIPNSFPRVKAALYFDGPGTAKLSYPIPAPPPADPAFNAFQRVARSAYWQLSAS